MNQTEQLANKLFIIEKLTKCNFKNELQEIRDLLNSLEAVLPSYEFKDEVGV